MSSIRARLNSFARRSAAFRGLNTSPVWRHQPVGRLGSKPLAMVWGNCQAEALRRILLTHPGINEDFRLLRLPAVHEVSVRELALIQKVLPRTEVLITQDIKSGYHDMELGTEQLIERLPSTARVVRYPIAYFEGLFPFHVYVNLGDSVLSASAPITDYHDLRILRAASKGWDVTRTSRWMSEEHLAAPWFRERAEKSLRELRRRENDLQVRLADKIERPEHITSGFHTINHPANELVVEEARQTLAHLGYADADRVLHSRQLYLDHIKAPREPQILRALGATVDPTEPQTWRTPRGEFTNTDVVEAHLRFYADRPDLLEAGLQKHRERLDDLDLALH